VCHGEAHGTSEPWCASFGRKGTRPESASHDHRPATCASADSASGSQNVISIAWYSFDSSGELDARLFSLAGRSIQPAQTPVAVGLERTHTQCLGEAESLTILLASLLTLRGIALRVMLQICTLPAIVPFLCRDGGNSTWAAAQGGDVRRRGACAQSVSQASPWRRASSCHPPRPLSGAVVPRRACQRSPWHVSAPRRDMAIARHCTGVSEDKQQLILGGTMVWVSTLQPMLDASWSRAVPVPALQADAARTRGLGLSWRHRQEHTAQARRFSLPGAHCQTG